MARALGAAIDAVMVWEITAAKASAGWVDDWNPAQHAHCPIMIIHGDTPPPPPAGG